MKTLDLQPQSLKGTLLELRPLKPDDFDALYLCASDPLIWEVHPESTRYQREVFERFFTKAIESKGAFVVLDSMTQEIIGSSRYYDYDPENKSVGIGYTFLTRKYWGGVYNKELKSLMCEHAFQVMDEIVFHVGIHNYRSQKAMEKIGGIVSGNRDPQTINYSLKKA
jgi:RimJ/RimL family protein N-acetyltransferase